jgi:hypothetical protein
MDRLNFPGYDFRLRENDGRMEIFDIFRKRYVALTPEEWVRQHLARFLAEERNVPAGLISIEARVKVLKMARRYDLVVFSKAGNPVLLAECKAPVIRIDQKVLDQVIRYNLSVHAPFILVTNGLNHACFGRDKNSGAYSQVADVPEYSRMAL